VTVHARRPLVVGNWKMNLGESAARALVEALVATFPFAAVDGTVAPAFPCLRAALDAAAATPLSVAAQNMHWEDKGAFTGEVAPAMLAGMGVRFVIIGHSERRAAFGDTDATVALKAAAAMRHGLVPIVCVGESEAERDAGKTHDVIAGQVRAGFAGGAFRNAGELVVAYEPVWAIGTGRAPAPEDVTSAHAVIREALGPPLRDARILYGGSVTAENAGPLLSAAEVDGALVGGASLEARSFVAIAAAATAC
jgi:triosephosphate isomerase